MIIMINGAFGVGKTSVAKALQQTIDNSMIYDPEEVGFMLRHVIQKDIMSKEEDTEDFQDIKLWRTMTVEFAKQLISTYNVNLIIPMTIHNKSYFTYIYEGFNELDETFHFCLAAKRETIHKRLIERGEEEGNWCFEQTDKCIRSYQDDLFEKFIVTDEAGIPEVVEMILLELDIRGSQEYGATKRVSK
ncbi:AAA family ATPase [Virgibacillus flavescens]|uniref:AAA family ATPase n=1 Tax=Virgibacillus flavescens TaxID=1611422 RepID=UPI003D34166C